MLLALLVAVGLSGFGVVAAAPGDARAEPAAIGQDVQAGPWTVTILDVLIGDDAASQVTVDAGLADGFSVVLVQVRAVNGGDDALAIDGDDFAYTGSSGNVYRFLDAIPPDPALDDIVEPGDTKEGWIVGSVPTDEQNLILLFDSLTLSGNWADRYFALQEGASIPEADGRAVKLNDVGRDPTAPAGLNDPMSTRDWVIEIVDVAVGQEVYDLYPEGDYRTTALADSQGGANIPYWVAFRVRVTNNRDLGGNPAYISPTAFMLADGNGDPVPDVLTLSPPSPDAAGAYFPGATREGWVAFEQPVDYPGALVRFLPYQTDRDPRYFAWDPDVAAAASAPTPTSGPITTGTTVVTTDDGVRLREEPSTSADIVDELPAGTELVVTGPAGEAEGISWLPVENPATGDIGFVAAEFVRAA